MTWDGDDLAGQAEEVFERQQAAADARAHRGASTVGSVSTNQRRLSASVATSTSSKATPFSRMRRLAITQ